MVESLWSNHITPQPPWTETIVFKMSPFCSSHKTLQNKLPLGISSASPFCLLHSEASLYWQMKDNNMLWRKRDTAAPPSWSSQRTFRRIRLNRNRFPQLSGHQTFFVGFLIELYQYKLMQLAGGAPKTTLSFICLMKISSAGERLQARTGQVWTAPVQHSARKAPRKQIHREVMTHNTKDSCTGKWVDACGGSAN